MTYSLNFPAQLADLGISMACNYANLAMSCGYAAAAVALSVPMAFAAAARPGLPALPSALPSAEATPFAAYRSGGGHASTHVVMGMPDKG